MLSCSRDFAWLGPDYGKEDECDGIDGGISIKGADLFEQCLQMRRCEIWTDLKDTAASLHRKRKREG